MIRSKSQSTPSTYSFVVVLVMLASAAHAQDRDTKAPVVRDIGGRRELFVDRFLIDRLDNATLKLHEPTKMSRLQSPLIGAYATVIRDGVQLRSLLVDEWLQAGFYEVRWDGPDRDGRADEILVLGRVQAVDSMVVQADHRGVVVASSVGRKNRGHHADPCFDTASSQQAMLAGQM